MSRWMPFLVRPAVPLIAASTRSVEPDRPVAGPTSNTRVATFPSATRPVTTGSLVTCSGKIEIVTLSAVTLPLRVSVPAPVETSPPTSVSGPIVSERSDKSSSPVLFTVTAAASGI
jgi:hypothetical protein